MRAVIIYNSLTGTTRKAAHRIASELKALRIDATPVAIGDVDDATVADADLVIIGTWTDGIVVLGEKPAGEKEAARPALAGRQACRRLLHLRRRPGPHPRQARRGGRGQGCHRHRRLRPRPPRPARRCRRVRRPAGPRPRRRLSGGRRGAAQRRAARPLRSRKF